VIWISTHPNTTTAENARDTSPDILALLEVNGVEGAVVEWYEGAVEKLSGPSLLRVTNDTNPTYYVRRFLTAGLGMPITTAECEDTDSQGSVAFFFHENKDKNGAPSAKVFGVSNCHVLRQDTTTDYKFKGAGAASQYVQLAGLRRFQRGLNEMRGCIGGSAIEAEILSKEIKELEEKPMSQDPEEAAEDKTAVIAKRQKLTEVKKDIEGLQTFYDDVKTKWSDIADRNIGHVDWAPKISVDVQGDRYSKDIGTFEVDAGRFEAHFNGNVVDLGAFRLTFLIFTSSNENNLIQDPSLLLRSSPTCSIPIVAVGRFLNIPRIASSRSGVMQHAPSLLNLTVLMTTATPAL
jgi:hypothetical protein